MLDSLTQSYPDKRLGKRVRNNEVPLYIGVLLHKFHCNWGKGYSSFSGGDRFMGFFISGFYCIRREKHKIRKSFDTQCDVRLTFVLMSFWHRGYHLCLMSLNVIRKKRSSTLLTISAVAILKPISFQRLSCCLRYRFYDWTKSPACEKDHQSHPEEFK